MDISSLKEYHSTLLNSCDSLCQSDTSLVSARTEQRCAGSCAQSLWCHSTTGSHYSPSLVQTCVKLCTQSPWAGLLANVTHCWLVASPTGQRDTGFCVLPSWCYASADHCHLPFMLCEQSIHHLTVILSQGLLLRPPCLLESSCQAMYPHSAGSSVMLPAVSSPLEETHSHVVSNKQVDSVVNSGC